MPLPLPNLDTRRWSDLVDQGRALIPRYAPTWTDYNVHDPGVTLIELLAWLVERAMYQVNRIPDRHRLKFLALEGVVQFRPSPAEVALALTFKGAAATLPLPAGVEFQTGGLRFRTRWALTLTQAQLITVQVYDGALYLDRTRALTDALPFPVFGANPTASSAPALLLGFDQPLPTGQTVTLYFRLQGATVGERARLVQEADEDDDHCRAAPPVLTCTPCPPRSDPWCDDPSIASGSVAGATSPPAASALPPHHSARLAWELWTAAGWRMLVAAAGEVDDDTRSLTLDGSVRLSIPVDMQNQSLGSVAKKRYYARARLFSGQYDSQPVLLGVAVNGVLAEQTETVSQQFTIAPGVVPTGAIAPGLVSPLTLALDNRGTVQQIDIAPASSTNPPIRVLAYAPATPAAPGAITLALRWVGTGNGLPNQIFQLTERPISHGAVQLLGLGAPNWQRWATQQDFDASGATDATIVLDDKLAAATVGDGVHGAVVPTGVSMVAAFDTTQADAGRIPSGQSWQLELDTWNRALLGVDPATIAPLLPEITNPAASFGGLAQEPLAHAIGRAGAMLWAHELLLGLCPVGSCDTLDQLDPAVVRGSPVPTRAATTLDFERIAVSVPGTRVRRARAWANIDPRYPGLNAPGAVTVVVVPELPAGLPTPSPGLLRLVSRYLDRRRVLCTRVLVVAPTYVVVSVTAQVQAFVGADPTVVQTSVVAALTTFIDPLVGGPAGRGWPFGRDVHSNEILAVIDAVPGVDHVLSLSMSADGGNPECGNLCVAPTSVAASGTHSIAVTGR